MASRDLTAPAALVLFALVSPALAQNGDRAGEEQLPLSDDVDVPPAPVLSPEEALATLAVHEGFRVELVAAEPLVEDPVQIVFDGSGRLWVVEMRGYMPDAEGRGEDEPVGVIAILSDTDGDGRMDRRDVFADGLVMPRSVHPCEGGALVVAPPEVLFLRDDDGDGAFDVREVLETGVAGLENPEHAINGLLYGRDNRYHLANWGVQYSRLRAGEGVTDDAVGRWAARRTTGGGQWGLSQDDAGRMYFNTNSSPLRAHVVPAEYARRNPHQRGFQGVNVSLTGDGSTWPSRINPGVNRGYQKNTLRADYRLRSVTAACSPIVYRGGAFGPEAEGDVFVCEPSGNLIKRYRVARAEDGVMLAAKGMVEEQLDFLTSTDERFRPVAGTTGPDGALYFADFARGIIQHRIYMTTFLRRQVDDRGLASPVGLGRIYRVVREDTPLHGVPDLAAASWAQLVAALGHPSGAVRDSAQRLIVEDFDGEADVAASLRDVARGAESSLARLHALWALEGIDELTAELLSAALKDPDPRVRHAALRVGEPWLELQGNDLVAEVLRVALAGTDAWVRHQAILTLGGAESEPADEALSTLAAGDVSSAFTRSGIVSGLRFRERAFLDRLAGDPRWREPREGRAALLRDLAGCVGREALTENVDRVLTLALFPPDGATWWRTPLLDGLLSARGKGPRGELRPLALAARPVALAAIDDGSLPDDDVGLAEAVAVVQEGCTWPGKPGEVELEPVRPLTAEEQAWFERGAAVYSTICSTCHQTHGGGEPGKAPPLRGSEWALGEPERLVKILLHGLDGPIVVDGETWNQEMPRFEGSAADLAAVATFVRRSWGNGADPVSPGLVDEVREATVGRRQPFTVEELGG